MELQQLITEHKTYRDEVFEALQELSKQNCKKLSKDEREYLKWNEFKFQLELSLRNSFISDLESLG